MLLPKTLIDFSYLFNNKQQDSEIVVSFQLSVFILSPSPVLTIRSSSKCHSFLSLSVSLSPPWVCWNAQDALFVSLIVVSDFDFSFTSFSLSSCNQAISHRIIRIMKYTCHMQLHCRITPSFSFISCHLAMKYPTSWTATGSILSLPNIQYTLFYTVGR